MSGSANTHPSDEEALRISALRSLIERQRVAAHRDSTAARRIGLLTRCIRLLAGNAEILCTAMAADFGWRSKDASKLTDIAAAVDALKHARAHVREWMRPERRNVDVMLGLLGGRAEVRFQPKGAIGIIAPWNFPVFLGFAPLAGVLAAGNRAVLKPSELAPQTAEMIASLVRAEFDEAELAVVVGDARFGPAFASLPFDHLVFTGSAHVARKVMAAAAENLTPVTLELGGKSPAIVSSSANLDIAAARIMAGKTLNCGQVCLAPDYILIPHDKTREFTEAAKRAVAAQYPTIADNPDYSAIIDQPHADRLAAMLADAAQKGARIIEINPGGRAYANRKMPPCIVLDVSDDMAIMREEIFGPVLPLKAYGDISEAVAYIQARPAPLALYYFGKDRTEQERVLQETHSGGVTVNDVIYHLAQNDLPFGGVGLSGMGRYQGRDGFLEFSNRRAVYRQTDSELIARMRPPYAKALRAMLRRRLKD